MNKLKQQQMFSVAVFLVYPIGHLLSSVLKLVQILICACSLVHTGETPLCVR